MNNPRLISLYQLYIDNNCSLEELQELEVLLRQRDNEEDFKTLLDQSWDDITTSRLNDIPQNKADEIYAAIIQSQLQLQPGQQQKIQDIQATGNRQTMQQQREIAEKQERAETQQIAEKQERTEKQESEEQEEQRSPDYKLWIAIAASIILVFSITISFYKNTSYNHSSGKLTSHGSTAKRPIADDIIPGTEKAVLTLSNGRKVLLGNHARGQITTQQSIASNQPDSPAEKSSSARTAGPVDAGQNTIAIPLAGQYHLRLPDGTLVYLNSASTLSYPARFSGNARVVTLIGEAYFEVTKNPKMPFRVNVNGRQQIEVLGTHFNVKAYPDEKQISTTLLEGSVKVSSGKEQVMLKPGQAALNDPAKPLMVKAADLEEVMAWKNGMFIFNDESITEIMKKISRWYDVEVVFNGNMEDISFTGNYSRSKSLSSLLQNIELMEKVRFSMEGRRITVIEK